MEAEAPTTPPEKADPMGLRKPQDSQSGMAAIAGKWPGDETEEEIEAALKRIS